MEDLVLVEQVLNTAEKAEIVFLQGKYDSKGTPDEEARSARCLPDALETLCKNFLEGR